MLTKIISRTKRGQKPNENNEKQEKVYAIIFGEKIYATNEIGKQEIIKYNNFRKELKEEIENRINLREKELDIYEKTGKCPRIDYRFKTPQEVKERLQFEIKHLNKKLEPEKKYEESLNEGDN